MSTKKSQKVDIINAIKRMTLAAGVKSEAQLMEFIGNKRGASTRWKERGTIPESAIRILNLKTGVLHDWILTGEGPMRDPEASPQIKEAPADYYSATTKAIADMVEQMDEDVRKDICLSVQKEKLLRDLLRQKESEEKAG